MPASAPRPNSGPSRRRLLAGSLEVASIKAAAIRRRSRCPYRTEAATLLERQPHALAIAFVFEGLGAGDRIGDDPLIRSSREAVRRSQGWRAGRDGVVPADVRALSGSDAGASRASVRSVDARTLVRANMSTAMTLAQQLAVGTRPDRRVGRRRLVSVVGAGTYRIATPCPLLVAVD
jgi:hypothetical protein